MEAAGSCRGVCLALSTTQGRNLPRARLTEPTTSYCTPESSTQAKKKGENQKKKEAAGASSGCKLARIHRLRSSGLNRFFL